MNEERILRAIAIFGIPFAFIAFLANRAIRLTKLPSFGATVLVHSLLYLSVCFGAVVLVTIGFSSTGISAAFKSWNAAFVGLVLAIFYVEIAIITAIRGVGRKLGPGTFGNWLRGYYYSPKREERIFMFLDMKDSTSLAEQLGDLKFSSLVRDFMQDLTSPVIETLATIDHYVGDEAILTWKAETGLANARCIQLFYRFAGVLESKREEYMREYGLVPAFKAGVQIGSVVATEVGTLKSEIVYHGDVVNTASRVQGYCSEVGEPLLVTSTVAERLPKLPWLDLHPIGDVRLKGKAESVGLVGVRLADR